jgi:hypothetical protein
VPTKQVLGRTRIDYKGDAAFIDMVKRAVARLGLPLSSYIRLALAERIERDGFRLPEPDQAPRPMQSSKALTTVKLSAGSRKSR